MTKVFAYLRVSSNGQIDGDGFDRQEAACRAFAEQKGWHIARVFRESQSGCDEWAGRKLLSEAMGLCGGVMEINTIIVERSDRIARDLIVGELFLRECHTRGIKVFAADSQQDLVNSEGEPTRTLIRQILGSLAQWDKACLVRKLTAGRKAKSERTGRRCGGPPVDKYGNRGGVSQQNIERRVIGHILFASKEGRNFTEIARYFTRRRIQIPHPNFVHRKGAVARSPFFWTRETIQGLYNEWVNTGSIIPFIGNNI